MGGVKDFNLPDCCYEYREVGSNAKFVDYCSDCGELIFEGEEYYDIRGMVLCMSCLAVYRKSGD